MKKRLGWLFYKLMGWKVDISIPLKEIDKSVLIAAPHTSNWDFFYTIFAFWYLELPFNFFIKDSWTKPWYGFFMKALGGYGIDRSARHNMVDFGANVLKNQERMYLLNTPEGSRSRAEKWKSGFYYIAKQAEVPIVLAYCDYEKKEAGIGRVIHLGDRSREDVMAEIQDFYKDVKAKYPENYNPKIF